MRITLEELLEPVDIEMFGESYRLRGVTRPRLARFEKVAQELQHLEERQLDEGTIKMLIDFIDLFLEPTGDAPPAQRLLTDRWRNGELEREQVLALAAAVSQQVERRANPRLPQTSGD